MPQVDTTVLAAAVEALGKIARAINARRLLAAPIRSVGSEYAAGLRKRLEAQALSDDQLDEIAVSAFEAGVIALHAAGAPGVTVYSCDGGLGSPEAERYMETRREG